VAFGGQDFSVSGYVLAAAWNSGQREKILLRGQDLPQAECLDDRHVLPHEG
jgi:hypothetical protein